MYKISETGFGGENTQFIKAEKIYSIEFYRFIFTMIIAIMHFKEDFNKINNNLSFPNIFKGGGLGVDFFFIILGFFCYESFIKNNDMNTSPFHNTIVFIGKKIKRLYPNTY